LKPEVVLLDLRLPDVDGLKILEEITAAQIKTYVVIITGLCSGR